MAKSKEKIKTRLAMLTWETGRAASGLGVKVGGLGTYMEELPAELVKAAARQNIDLDIEILSPCFAHYDKSKFTKLDLKLPVTMGGVTFQIEVYQYVFPDGQKVTYFWDKGQLGWTNSTNIYPSDHNIEVRLFATMSQAMAAYIKQANFETIHLHDYHVGLTPFYLGDDDLKQLGIHFTIHNGTYQGAFAPIGGSMPLLDQLNLPGEKLYQKYFDHAGSFNMLKACMLKVHEMGGKVTTLSGDIGATWGYAAELKQDYKELFKNVPIIGITNGISADYRPENLAELKADVLKSIQEKRGAYHPLFCNPTTQNEMLARDHNFDAKRLNIRTELRRLLHLETFGREPHGYPYPILISAIGRLADQKNFELIAEVVERVVTYDARTEFIIMASGANGNKALENQFFRLSNTYRDRVYFNNSNNLPLAKLILAGGDFTLIPSLSEPCSLSDYEASMLGSIVIGQAIGGLNKVRDCAYLYEWNGTNGRKGEADILFEQIKLAIDNFRQNKEYHIKLMSAAMAVESSWDASASQYIEMYRYGLLNKKWHQQRQSVIDQFINSLGEDKAMFSKFFVPVERSTNEDLDWQLKESLTKVV